MTRSANIYSYSFEKSGTGNSAARIYRKKRSTQTILLALICVIVGIVIGYLLVPGVTGEASSNYTTETYYTSVRVEAGMTLSDIEEEYNDNSGISSQEYIASVKKINHLTDDTIHSGSYLSIPYEVVISE